MTNTTTRSEHDARLAIAQVVRPGDTITSVSRGNTQARTYVSLLVTDPYGRGIHRLDELVVKAGLATYPRGRNQDGVDTGGRSGIHARELVAYISRSVYPQGWDCIGVGCPSEDHVTGGVEFQVAGSRHTDSAYRFTAL